MYVVIEEKWEKNITLKYKEKPYDSYLYKSYL